MQILGETGCYADMTLPTAPFHGAQTRKTNAIYECGAPLGERAPHGKGREVEVGHAARTFPIMVQGALMLDFHAPGRHLFIDNSALTASQPPSLHRLENWKRAGISVKGRPDWVFVKLHCHGMDPRDDEALMGAPTQQFLRANWSTAQRLEERYCTSFPRARWRTSSSRHATVAREILETIETTCLSVSAAGEFAARVPAEAVVKG